MKERKDLLGRLAMAFIFSILAYILLFKGFFSIMALGGWSLIGAILLFFLVFYAIYLFIVSVSERKSLVEWPFEFTKKAFRKLANVFFLVGALGAIYVAFRVSIVVGIITMVAVYGIFYWAKVIRRDREDFLKLK